MLLTSRLEWRAFFWGDALSNSVGHEAVSPTNSNVESEMQAVMTKDDGLIQRVDCGGFLTLRIQRTLQCA